MPARPLRRLVAVLVCSACLLFPQAASSDARRRVEERRARLRPRDLGRRPRRIEHQPDRRGERYPVVGRSPHPVGAHRDRLRRRGERLDARSEGRGGWHVRVRTGPAREPQAVRAGVVPRVRLDARAGPGADVLRSPGDRPLLPVRERERDGGVDAGRRRGRVPSERPGDDPRGAPRARARDRHGRSRRGSGRPAPSGRDRDRDAEGLRDAPDRDADRPALQPPRRIPRRRSRRPAPSRGGGLVVVPRRDRAVVDARFALGTTRT